MYDIVFIAGRYIMTSAKGGGMEDKDKGVSRRQFIETAAIAGAGLTIVPRHVLGMGYTAPSDLLNIATVGIGGMGHNNTMAVGSQNIVAICDVDWDYAQKSIDNYARQLEQRKNPQQNDRRQNGGPREQGPVDPARAPVPIETMQRIVDQTAKAKRYTDYREMLAQQKDIDAVIVATPDHMHAPIALAAMDLGKHVYVQKPLCWCVDEARALARKAKDNPKIATQMGNQGHSGAESRMTVEYIQQGAIGDVNAVQVWTNRPLGYWPQGLPRPKALSTTNANGQGSGALGWNGRAVEARLAAALAAEAGAMPDKLNWDLFLGVAPKVDYHPVYHPFNRRGWVDGGPGQPGSALATALPVVLRDAAVDLEAPARDRRARRRRPPRPPRHPLPAHVPGGAAAARAGHRRRRRLRPLHYRRADDRAHLARLPGRAVRRRVVRLRARRRTTTHAVGPARPTGRLPAAHVPGGHPVARQCRLRRAVAVAQVPPDRRARLGTGAGAEDPRAF